MHSTISCLVPPPSQRPACTFSLQNQIPNRLKGAYPPNSPIGQVSNNTKNLSELKQKIHYAFLLFRHNSLHFLFTSSFHCSSNITSVLSNITDSHCVAVSDLAEFTMSQQNSLYCQLADHSLHGLGMISWNRFLGVTMKACIRLGTHYLRISHGFYIFSSCKLTLQNDERSMFIITYYEFI